MLCRQLDISRKSGYKIFSRYKDSVLEGLTDRSRRHIARAASSPFPIEQLILQVKREHPSWGAPKIREKIRRKHCDIQLPAISTVHAVLHRHGLVNVYRRRLHSHKAQGTALSRPVHPNELSCANYKSEFMLADRICCEALSSTQASLAFTVFERLFKEFGLPSAIRTDNGVPFASPNSLFNLSKLSVCGCGLGSLSNASSPLTPQNGRHERMHLTLKKGSHQACSQDLPEAAGALRSLSTRNGLTRPWI